MNCYEKENILVTGGAGFIGSKLCEALINLHYNVVCFDNFSTGKLKNIKHLTTNLKFKLIGGDIRNFQDCKKACKGVDTIFHYANYTAEENTFTTIKKAHDVNITGFVNILVAAKEANVKGFAFWKNIFGLTAKNTKKSELLIKKAYVETFNSNCDLQIVDIAYSFNEKVENIIAKNLKVLTENYKKKLIAV